MLFQKVPKSPDDKLRQSIVNPSVNENDLQTESKDEEDDDQVESPERINGKTDPVPIDSDFTDTNPDPNLTNEDENEEEEIEDTKVKSQEINNEKPADSSKIDEDEKPADSLKIDKDEKSNSFASRDYKKKRRKRKVKDYPWGQLKKKKKKVGSVSSIHSQLVQHYKNSLFQCRFKLLKHTCL